MKKMSMIAAVAALFVAASAASAGTINLYFSTASSTGSTCPAFSAGNPILYLAPSNQNATITTRNGGNDPGYNRGSLYQYMQVATRAGGPGDEIVSSLGQDIVASAAVGGTASLTATAFTVFNTAAETGAAGQPWSPAGVNTPTVAAAPALVTNSRAVNVPPDAASFVTTGFGPGGPYRTAQLVLLAGNAGAGEGQTSYDIRMKVGTLKITRVYDPTAANPNQPTPEDVSFGYEANNSGPEIATVSGSTVGAVSTIKDATVIIRKKGDFGFADPDSGDFVFTPDGNIDNDDVGYLYGHRTGPHPGLTNAEFEFLGDFGFADPDSGDFITTPDCSFDNDDVGFMYGKVKGS